MKFDDNTADIVREPSQDIVCEFVDGNPFGNAIGIGLRSRYGWWTVTAAEIKSDKVGDSFYRTM